MIECLRLFAVEINTKEESKEEEEKEVPVSRLTKENLVSD